MKIARIAEAAHLEKADAIEPCVQYYALRDRLPMTIRCTSPPNCQYCCGSSIAKAQNPPRFRVRMSRQEFPDSVNQKIVSSQVIDPGAHHQ